MPCSKHTRSDETFVDFTGVFTVEFLGRRFRLLRVGLIELPMSMPIVATVAVDLSDTAALLRFDSAPPSITRGRAGARPDHSISGHSAVVLPTLFGAGRPHTSPLTICQCANRHPHLPPAPCGAFRDELAKLGGRKSEQAGQLSPRCFVCFSCLAVGGPGRPRRTRQVCHGCECCIRFVRGAAS